MTKNSFMKRWQRILAGPSSLLIWTKSKSTSVFSQDTLPISEFFTQINIFNAVFSFVYLIFLKTANVSRKLVNKGCFWTIERSVHATNNRILSESGSIDYTRPSILCVTHQMSRKKRNYSVGWTVPYDMMNHKLY